MSQSKASDTTKSVKRKASSARKSSTARKPSTARKSSTARKTAASRAPAKHATTGQPGRNGVGPREKRTISAFGFIGEVARKMSESPSIKAIYDGRLNEGSREELMVAVAFQNQAPYCNWGHRIWASLAGISDEELGKIEKLNLDELDPKVATAIIYVRALVSSEWQDAPRDLRQQMHEYFTWREIEDIELIARAMDISNRAGNTWDAMLSRLKGQPIENSDLLSEIFFSYLFLCILPNRLHKVSRLTGVSVLDAAQKLASHVQQFNRRETPTGAS
jgi:alkylhydroperoxidase family enzyme